MAVYVHLPRIPCHDEELFHANPEGIPGTKVIKNGHSNEGNDDENSTKEEQPREGSLQRMKETKSYIMQEAACQ